MTTNAMTTNALPTYALPRDGLPPKPPCTPGARSLPKPIA